MDDRAKTVGATLTAAERAWPDREALVIGDRRATYAELSAEASACARSLMGLGVQRGDRIGLLLHNCWESVLLFHAASLIGATVVPLNARYRADELRYVVGFSDIVGLVTSAHGRRHVDLRRLLTDTFPDLADWTAGSALALAEAPMLRWVANLADPGETHWVTKRHMTEVAQRVPAGAVAAAMRTVRADDICLTMFSSGTTARPKACMLTHDTLGRVGEALAERFTLSGADRFWDPLPFYHMSTMLPLAACRAVGATFIGVEHFEPSAALAELARTRATILYPAFPTLMASMIAHPDFAHSDLSRIRLMLNIGPPDLLRRFAAALPGAKQVSCYGLTEGGGVCCYNEPDDTLDQRVETAGRPISGAEIRIVDSDTLRPLAANEIGEIWIRGPCVFAGYYKDPDRTREAITPEGWLRTGDLGLLRDDGRLVFKGRLKDMLKIGGENVAAVEIESFLMRHPAVKMAQVIGVPDERLVEAAAAFVELQPGASATESGLVAFCAGQIASFKIPRHVRFVDAWPMSATKIQKFRLREGFLPATPIDVAAILRRAGSKR